MCPLFKMSAFVCMQCFSHDCLFGVLHPFSSLSLIYPLCDAFLAAVFSTFAHIHTPLWSNKEAGMALIGIVIKSDPNSRTSAYGANNESHNTRNAYKVRIRSWAVFSCDQKLKTQVKEKNFPRESVYVVIFTSLFTTYFHQHQCHNISIYQ